MAPRVVHGTLDADQVELVELDRDFQAVEVLNVDGAAAIYFTVDGPNPTVEGEDCEVLPAALGALKVQTRNPQATEVRLISEGTPKFSVRGV